MGIISATTLHYGIVIYDVKIKALVILIYVAIVIIFLKNVSEYNKIEKKIRNIVSGEYQSEIKTDNKYLKNMVQDINNIKKGIENAVNEKVKSERLKTDLITNVSHDLKTPLTSIINYANLLKKENIENENAQKYIEILENKSKKLKNLTEDLIEASKISSGNETVNLQKLNFAEMILQANGEFAEKYESKDLKLISKIEKEGIFAQLDSKKMWRVLENIYNNAYKHSLEGTRIYVNVEQNDKIVFTMKNISKEELNITPEELMERFVRGDKSRTSGGNGLRSFNS
jgi:signal transduction histidine kinase